MSRIDDPASISAQAGRPAGCLANLFATFFFGIFLLVGLGVAGFLAKGIWEDELQTQSWIETPCRILDSAVVLSSTFSKEPYRLAVRFTYEAGGATYSGNLYRKGGYASADRDTIARLTQRFASGVETVCYVHPDDPAQAVLSRSLSWTPLVILFPLIFVAIGLFGIIGTWRGSRKKAGKESISAGGVEAGSGRGLAIAAWFFLLIGFALAVPFLFLPLTRILSARFWTETPCAILSSNVGSHSSDDGTTYSIDIYYRYEIDGVEYRSGRYGFMDASSSGRASKAAAVAAHRAGSQRTCWVNPGDPDQAVLNRNPRPIMLVGIIPLVVIGVGVLLRRGALRDDFRDPDEIYSAPAGSIELKSRMSPFGKLAAALFVALFWNGIVSVFLYQLIAGWRRGDFEVFLALFLTPFVLIGLLLIVLVVYQLLALFNPVPTMRLDPGRLVLGGRAALDWSLSGAASRIRRFTVTLEGRETATYRRGTSTVTQKSLFHRQPLLELDDSRQMRRGRVEFDVPRLAMHSFISGNNRIVWTLRIHGDIQRWPDVDDEFEVTVDPLPAGGTL